MTPNLDACEKPCVSYDGSKCMACRLDRNQEPFSIIAELPSKRELVQSQHMVRPSRQDIGGSLNKIITEQLPLPLLYRHQFQQCGALLNYPHKQNRLPQYRQNVFQHTCRRSFAHGWRL